jgi:protein-disulfide isomerase
LTIVTCLALLWVIVTDRRGAPSKKTYSNLPSKPLHLDETPVLGDEKASVGIIVFSEFQCPFCGKFAREVWPSLKSEFVATGRVLISFRHYPLPSHKFAAKASEAAECAGQQGRFWEMHDVLFQDQQALDSDNLERDARSLGLDLIGFDSCIHGQQRVHLQRDLELGKSLGVTGTPTFFLGKVLGNRTVSARTRIDGVKPVDAFRSALDLLLQSSNNDVPQKL